LFYDYGVDKTTTELPYRTYYYSEKDKKYDFTTVLYSIEKGPKGAYNYNDFNVTISHMYKETHQKEYKGRYISKINFSDFTTDDDIKLVPNSIVLVHKDKNGNKIQYEEYNHDLDRIPEGKYRNHYYQQIYDPSVLPSEISEYISLEVFINGDKKKIEYNLPIKKALHYTWWDVMMGV
jgi:hypothetical protein